MELIVIVINDTLLFLFVKIHLGLSSTTQNYYKKNNTELKINTKSVLVNWKRENKYFISTKRCNRKGIRCTRDGTVTMKQKSILLETWHKINQLADSSQNLRKKGIGTVPA